MSGQIIFNVLIILAFIVLLGVFLLTEKTTATRCLAEISKSFEPYLPARKLTDPISVLDLETVKSVPKRMMKECQTFFTSNIDDIPKYAIDDKKIFFLVGLHHPDEILTKLQSFTNNVRLIITEKEQFTIYTVAGFTVFYLISTKRWIGANREIIGKDQGIVFIEDQQDVNDVLSSTSPYENLQVFTRVKTIKRLRSFEKIDVHQLYLLFDHFDF